MNKIEKLEKLLMLWKAADLKNSYGLNPIQESENWGKILGLEAALKILKEPSNTQLKSDGLKTYTISCPCTAEGVGQCGQWCRLYPPTT